MVYGRNMEKKRKAQGVMARRNRKGFGDDGSGEVKAVSDGQRTVARHCAK